MRRDTWRYLVLTTLGCMAAGVVIFGIAGADPVRREHWDMDGRVRGVVVPEHGKLRPPGEVHIEVTDAGEAGGPVSVTIHAASLVPVRSGAIAIMRPGVSEAVEGLWSTAEAGLIAKSVAYTTDPMADGTCHLVASFEFVPDREGAERMVVAESIYLDVRPDRVLSSRVSFDQIQRIELYEELEERALVSLNPALAGASRKAKDQGLAKLEATSPGRIAKKVAQIRANDPAVVRRIEELNRIKNRADGLPESTKRDAP